MSQWKRGFVATEWTIVAARTTTIAAATQRPGWRTGPARICSGLAGAATSCRPADAISRPSASSALGRVDLGRADRAPLDSPPGQDALVRPVLHERLHRLWDGLDEPRALGDRDAVRRRAVGLARHLELPVGLLDDVGGDRRVGHPTWARPLEIARFAPFWSGNVRTLTLHFFPCASASACCVVPFSTATVLLHRAASDMTAGPPAFV